MTIASAAGHLRSLTLADGSANILPETSVSSDRVYFLDGDRQLKWLKPDGSMGTAGEVPGSGSEESAFAVAPDNSRIAVADFKLGAQRSFTYALTVAGLDGSGRKVVVQSSGSAQTSAIEWPVAWRGTSLLLQRGLLYNQYPYGYSSMAGFRLLDSDTGNQQATICGNNQQVWSPPVAAGVVCNATFNFAVQSLDGKTTFSSTQCAPWSPSLAPDGSRWAGRPSAGSGGSCSNTSDPIALYAPDRTVRSTGITGSPWGWIDAQHLVVNHESEVEAVSTPFRLVNVADNSVIETHLTGRFVAVLPAAIT